jgi:hypothetical protein
MKTSQRQLKCLCLIPIPIRKNKRFSFPNIKGLIMRSLIA